MGGCHEAGPRDLPGHRRPHPCGAGGLHRRGGVSSSRLCCSRAQLKQSCFEWSFTACTLELPQYVSVTPAGCISANYSRASCGQMALSLHLIQAPDSMPTPSMHLCSYSASWPPQPLHANEINLPATKLATGCVEQRILSCVVLLPAEWCAWHDHVLQPDTGE